MTAALLQARLRAVALFFVATIAVFIVWRGLVLRDGSLSPLQPAALCFELAVFALLSSPARLPVRALRAVELTTFGLMVTLLAAQQYATMFRLVGRRDGASLVGSIEATLFAATILIMAHAMLIPNTWRGAARGVLGLAAVPFATVGVLILAHPEALGLIHGAVTFERVAQDLLLTLVGAGLAIYGAHVLGSLRAEAFEARRLNQYRLLRRLGQGGMGEVHLAEHDLLKRPCALKLIRPELVDPRSLERFEREVRATARLTHPNTVEIYDYGQTEDGTFFYVMEYLRGLSLADLLDRRGPLPPGRVIYLLRQACDALGEAHAAGLIHRDVKPANLFAAERGGRRDFLKLLDFGLVKSLDGDPTATPGGARRIQGTPQYMAPEQIQDAPGLDHRCDLYALGSVAYELLTGHALFEVEDVSGMLAAQVRNPVVPPSRHRPDLPDDLERVVLRLLAKAPADRYPDAASVALALASCANAGTWDDSSAARWWRDFEAEMADPPAS